MAAFRFTGFSGLAAESVSKLNRVARDSGPFMIVDCRSWLCRLSKERGIIGGSLGVRMKAS